MSKAIMISIKPKYVAKILNGDKTIEIRKTMPKCDLPIDVYVYCTKDSKKGWCMVGINGNETYYQKYDKNAAYSINHNYIGNGKVVAKFTLNSFMNCKLINDSMFDNFFYSDYQLTKKELKDYVGDNDFYEWYISNLVIFDKPKELSEFSVRCPKADVKFDDVKGKMLAYKPLTKAPQSWCYIEV